MQKKMLQKLNLASFQMANSFLERKKKNGISRLQDALESQWSHPDNVAQFIAERKRPSIRTVFVCNRISEDIHVFECNARVQTNTFSVWPSNLILNSGRECGCWSCDGRCCNVKSIFQSFFCYFEDTIDLDCH